MLCAWWLSRLPRPSLSAGLPALPRRPRPPLPQAISVTQQADAQQTARALLGGSLAVDFSAAERAEMTKIANGEFSAGEKSKWDLIKDAFGKVKGFSKAVAGKYSDFKKWYDGLPWYAKAPLAAVSPG